MADIYVQNVQRWVNNKFRGYSGYTVIPENGETGWTTIYALLHGLQITLEVGSTADNFGNGTINAFNAFVNKNGAIQERSALQDKELQDEYNTSTGEEKEELGKLIDQYEKIHGIIQGALLCKGYAIGTNTPTGNFYAGTTSAIKQLKEDAGIDNSTSVVTLNIMKALLSMDYFYSYDTSERTQKIIAMQRYLNGNYENYIGLTPCDGVYGRDTSKAIIYAIQAEEGMPTSVANGNCGPSTKNCLPTIHISGVYSGANYNGQSYSSASINKFKILANMALYFNGFGSGNITSGIILSVIKSFQAKYAIPQTGNLDYTTWLSLLVSCGNTERSAIACDCITRITNSNVSVLKNNNYQYIGRYLTNVEGGLDKKLTADELQVLFSNGIRLFPILQKSATSIDYFSVAQGMLDGAEAVSAANGFNLQFGSIIYFAVDFDATNAQITSHILPYFQALFNTVVREGKAKYRVGVYGTRNVCTRVTNAGYACSSFVSDMSTGYSGNLGFTIPDNWALDQFATTTISSNGQSIEIDKDGFSGQYKGISQEYSKAIPYANTIEEGTGRILINMTETSVPVYERKEPNLPEVTPTDGAYNPAGNIIGYINPHDMYVRFGVENPSLDNVHKVMFNDGTDVKVGFIREKWEFASIGADPYDDNVIELQILDGHEIFTYVEYVPSSGQYLLHQWADVTTREFYINKPVYYLDASGNYAGTLQKGDRIKINRNNLNNPGYSRPWATRINGIKFNGNDTFTDFSGYACIGLEYASSGSERAWY